MVTCIILSFLLISIDHQQRHLASLRSALSLVVYPINYAVSAPIKFFGAVSDNVKTRRRLVLENRVLRDENLMLRSKSQRLNAVQTENRRLRELLDSSSDFTEDVVVADVMAIETSPSARQLVLNKGSRENIYIGQPVVDAYGVLGQIVRVGLFSSTALLISDVNHALPVQLERNGLRAIAVGGDANQLKLSFVPVNADINIGDRVLTSGLGQQFPPGYPVGEVTDIKLEPGAPFQEISINPAADADRVSQVLLVSSTGVDSRAQSQRAEP